MVKSILNSFDVWIHAQGVKSRGRVKNIDNISLDGITRLRELILELAIQGKLVPQYPQSESAELDIRRAINEKKSLFEKGLLRKEKQLSAITKSEKLFDIPKNWNWVKAGEIGITNIGLTYSPNDVSSEGIIVLRSSNVQNGEIDLTDLVRVNKKVDDKVLVEKGDLLICARNGSRQLVGKCALIKIVDEPLAFGAFMAIFRSRFNEYIKIFIESPYYRKNLDGVSTTTINQITQDNLRNTVVPFPPLEEQKRIVVKVNELLALCDELEKQQTKSLFTHQALVKNLLETLINAADSDELENAWNKISAHFDTLFCTEDSIEQLKQAILQLAVMGKLVNQDPNDESANILVEKIFEEKGRLIRLGAIKRQKDLLDLKQSEISFNLPSGWVYSRLGAFTIVGTGATPSRDRIDYYFPAEVNWVTSGETDQDFINETNEKVSLLALKETNVSIYPKGSLVIAMYGQGKTRGQVSELMIDAGTNQACAVIVFLNKEQHHRQYLKLFFKKAYEEIRSNAEGGAQPNLNLSKIANTVIPLPPLSEQKRIVIKVQELFSICDSLSKKISSSQEIQNMLSRSIIESVSA